MVLYSLRSRKYTEITAEAKPRSNMTYKLSVVVERDAHGYFSYVPELPGCMSQGATSHEALESVREAAELYLEDLDPEERES
jgi:predicted RNase H-like HicB family nuclease